MAYTRIIENLVLTSTLRIEGSAYDNTLIRNVTIRNASGDGIFLRNVDNVMIQNVTIDNVKGDGIRLSSEGSTSNVTIQGSTISDIGEDGINAGQRDKGNVDHPGLKILGNTIDNTGLNGGNDGLRHGMYIQSSDFLIEGNVVTRSVDGNGISVRSSGTIRDNYVEESNKSGIAYFADHPAGKSGLLTIEDNIVIDSGNGERRADIDLLSVPTASNAIDRAIVRDNILTSKDKAVGVGKGYDSVTQSGNTVVSEAAAKAAHDGPSIGGGDSGSGGGTGGDVAGQTITGTAGADKLIGGAGDDVLTGRGGADTFTFRDDSGSDTITDFNARLAGETIRLVGFDLRDIGDLSPLAREVSGDTVLRFDNGETLTIEDVSVRDLASNDFIFV